MREESIDSVLNHEKKSKENTLIGVIGDQVYIGSFKMS